MRHSGCDDGFYEMHASLYVPATSVTGTVLTPAGEEAAVAGIPVSLASSNHLVVGTSSLGRQSLTIFTMAGHTTPPTAISLEIATTSVKAGEPAVTVSGTIISMGVSVW